MNIIRIPSSRVLKAENSASGLTLACPSCGLTRYRLWAQSVATSRKITGAQGRGGVCALPINF